MEASHRPGWRIKLPVAVLSVLSIVGGFVNLPSGPGNLPAFMDLLHSALPEVAATKTGSLAESLSGGSAAIAFALGLGLAYTLFLRRRSISEKLAFTGIGHSIREFWFHDWGMDWLYERAFVRPVIWFATVDKSDFLDAIYDGTARVTELSWRALRTTETGRVRWYAAWITAGTVIFVAIILWK